MKNFRTLCPHCKQEIREERSGIRLPPLKAAIYDAIKQAGDEGISTLDVLAIAYSGRERQPHYFAIKTHVAQINDLLVETNLIIKSDRCNRNGAWPRWRLVPRDVGATKGTDHQINGSRTTSRAEVAASRPVVSGR